MSQDKVGSEGPLIPEPQIFHQLYQGIVIGGIVFTTILLISMTLGKRKNKRHPIVIFFLFMAMLSYWNAISPWLVDLWNTNVYRANVNGVTNIAPDTVQHAICRLNTILGSFFRAVMPSFAATFVGEALRIVLNIWRYTYPEVSGATRPDAAALFSNPVLLEDEKMTEGFGSKASGPEFIIYPDTPNPTLAVPRNIRWESEPPGNERDLQRSSIIYTYTRSLPSNVSEPRIASYDMDQLSSCLRPATLCLIPVLCGLPPLITTIIANFGADQASIYADMVKCSAISHLVDTCTVAVLMLVLAFTVILSAMTVTSLYILPGPASIIKTRNLDKTFLIRISILSIVSALGCLIIAVVKIASYQAYAWILDLYFVLQPVFASAALVDFDCFLVWAHWLRIDRLVEFLAPSCGRWFRRADDDIEPSHKTWTPPRPSYSRAHRPTSASTAGGSDVSSYHEATEGLSRKISHKLAHGFYMTFSRKRPGTANRVSWWTFPMMVNQSNTALPPSRARAKSVGFDTSTTRVASSGQNQLPRRKSDWAIGRPPPTQRPGTSRTRKISNMLTTGIGEVYRSFSRTSPVTPRRDSWRSFPVAEDATSIAPLNRDRSKSLGCELESRALTTPPRSEWPTRTPVEMVESPIRNRKISEMISKARSYRPFSRGNASSESSSSLSTAVDTSPGDPQQVTIDMPSHVIDKARDQDVIAQSDLSLYSPNSCEKLQPPMINSDQEVIRNSEVFLDSSQPIPLYPCSAPPFCTISSYGNTEQFPRLSVSSFGSKAGDI